MQGYMTYNINILKVGRCKQLHRAGSPQFCDPIFIFLIYNALKILLLLFAPYIILTHPAKKTKMSFGLRNLEKYKMQFGLRNPNYFDVYKEVHPSHFTASTFHFLSLSLIPKSELHNLSKFGVFFARNHCI